MKLGIGDFIAIVVAILKVFGLISTSWWTIIGWWFIYFVISLIISLIAYEWKK